MTECTHGQLRRQCELCERDAAIAELRERHAAFVRKVREIAEIAPNYSPAMLQLYMNDLADQCDAELGKEEA